MVSGPARGQFQWEASAHGKEREARERLINPRVQRNLTGGKDPIAIRKQTIHQE